MSYRPLLSVLILWPLVQVSSALAQTPACKPNYQVTQTDCRESTDILSYTTVIERNVVVNKGACKVPDAIGLCREFIPRYQQAHPGAERIEVSNPSTDSTSSYCGDAFKKIQKKVDVSCDFTYQAPQHRKYSDANCQVEKIEDVNHCFAPSVPSLEANVVSECLAKTVSSRAELWIKGVCLHDISQAALNLNISPVDYEQIQSKLSIIKNKIKGDPDYAKLIQILDVK